MDQQTVLLVWHHNSTNTIPTIVSSNYESTWIMMDFKDLTSGTCSMRPSGSRIMP